MEWWSKACTDGLELSETSRLLTLLGVKTVLCIIGFALLVFVYIYQNPMKSFHANSQILFKFHCFFIVTGILGTSFTDGLDLLRFTLLKSDDENCPVAPLSAFIGVGLKAIKVFGNNGVVYTMTALAIERIVSSLQTDSYERRQSTLGWILSLISMLVSALLVAVRVSLADYSALLSITSFTKVATAFSMKLQYSAAVVEITTAVLLFILLFLNLRRLRRRERIVNSLAYKAQIRENVNATALAFPLAFIHLIVYLPSAVFMPTLALSKSSLSDKMQAIATTDFVPLYYVFFPLVLWWRNRAKKVSVANLFVANLINRKGEEQRAEGAETAKYFEMLNKMLN